MDNHVLGQLMRELGIERRDMGAKVFVHYRESFGEHTTFLRLKVLVPVCPDCWMTDPRMSYQVPNISSESWDVDLLLLGFHPQTIEKLKTDIMEGVESERGPWCFICGEWIPWWEKEGGCYTKEVEFAEYFGLVEKENPLDLEVDEKTYRRNVWKEMLRLWEGFIQRRNNRRPYCCTFSGW